MKNDMNQDMTLAEFTRLLDIHGGDFSRWPQDRIRAACRFLETSAEARAAHTSALALDDMLSLHQPGPLPEIVTARLMQTIDRAPARPLNDNFAGLPAFTRHKRPAQWAMAACAVLLLVIGFGLRPLTTTTEAPQMLASNATATEVDLFLLSMADPFIESLRADELMAPLEMASLRTVQTFYDVDLFLDSLMREELAELATP